MGSVSFECREIPRAAGSQIDFGVEVTGLDIENLSGKPFFDLGGLLNRGLPFPY